MSNPSPLQDRIAQWVGEHARRVRGYLLGMVRKEDVADDLTQEVFRRALLAADRYEERGRVRAYLLRIADRLACDWGRRAGREVNGAEGWEENVPDGEDREPSDQVIAAETAQQLTAALDTLSPAQRRVLLLRFYGEMDFSQIAETTEMPLNTVLSHCHRGLATLRKRLVLLAP